MPLPQLHPSGLLQIPSSDRSPPRQAEAPPRRHRRLPLLPGIHPQREFAQAQRPGGGSGEGERARREPAEGAEGVRVER